jgi:hypothetical protein
MSMNKTSSFETVGILDAAAIPKFSGGLTSYVILPADLGYETARWSWNRAVKFLFSANNFSSP